MSLGRKFLLTQNKVIEISFIVCVSDKVGLTCSEVWRLVSLLFLPGEEVAHPGGLLASCQRCGAQQGAVSTYLRWGQFIPKNLARDSGLQKLKLY